MSDKFIAVAAHSLIEKDGKYLITLRSPVNDYMPNTWDTPGGGVHFGEEIVPALAREILEETGLNCEIGHPIFVFSQLSNPSRHQYQIVYKCRYLGGDIKLSPEEHSDFRWVSVDELQDLPDKIHFLAALSKDLSSQK